MATKRKQERLERRKERRIRRAELAIQIGLATGRLTDEDARFARAKLAEYRAGKIDWETFWETLLKYLPALLELFFMFFG